MNKFKQLSLPAVLLLAAAAPAIHAQAIPDFLAPATYPTGGNSSLLVVADFNGDRIPDVAIVEAATQGLSLLYGAVDGTLQPPVSQPLGFTVSSIAAADFNNDGKVDLAFSTATNIAILLNSGNGSFGLPIFVSATISPNYVTTGDFNLDGVVDLAVAGSTGFSVLLGTGAGSFAPPVVLPQLTSSFYVLVADFNNDGQADLVGDGGVQGVFYAGVGDGTFRAPVSTIAVPSGTLAADFNMDGKLDLITRGAQQRQHGTVQMLSVSRGGGDGTFVGFFDYVFSGASIGLPAIGDFNADGKPDAAVWQGSTGSLLILNGKGDSTLVLSATIPVPAGGVLSAADIDANGSKDLLLLTISAVTTLRNTHGNPPLLAALNLQPSATVGGTANVVATATLGGPAPAGGVALELSTSNPALAFVAEGPSVTMPAGASSTTFTIVTSAVAAPSTVTVSAKANSVTQNATLSLVAPYALSALRVNPVSQFGIFSVRGTVALTGPADSNAVVLLASANPALASVPASVTVPAGATTATFSIVLHPVAADTPVTIRATRAGVSRNAVITILKPQDSVQVDRAIDTVKSAQLRVDATGSNANAVLTVWNAATQVQIGTLTSSGGGKYSGTFTVSPAVLSITLKSSFGGSATSPVVQK